MRFWYQDEKRIELVLTGYLNRFGTLQANLNICQSDIKKLYKKADKVVDYNLTECEECGCVIFKHERNQADKEIRKKSIIADGVIYPGNEDYIHTTYKCKACRNLKATTGIKFFTIL